MDAKHPLRILRELMSGEQRAALVEDPRRCKALLLDYCGAHRREINLLVKAHEEQIPARLLSPAADVPPAVRVAQLSSQLADDWGLSESAARWAVEAWAWALDIIETPPANPPAESSNAESATAPPETATPASESLNAPPGAASTVNQRAFGGVGVNAPRRARVVEGRAGGITQRTSAALISTVTTLLLCLCCFGAAMSLVMFYGPRPGPTPTPTLPWTTAPHWPPALHSPAGKVNCFNDRLQLDLRWDAPASNWPIALYRIQTEPGEEQIPHETDTRAWILDVPCASRDYRWRVQAQDERGIFGGFSPWNRFSVNCTGEVCTVTPLD